jgi:integrase
MTGSLRHLGGDRYQVRYYVGRDPTNPARQITKTKVFHAKGKRAAEKAFASHVVAIEQALKDAARHRGTVRELVDIWEKDRADFSPNTIKRNRSILRTIRADLGAIRAHDLTTLHVDQWLSKLRARGLSPSTVHQYSRVLSTMLRDGMRWGKVTRNAADLARKPKVPKPDVDPPTMGELRILLTQSSGDLQAALWVLALTGLRRSELCGLRWSDIRGGMLYVERTVVELADRLETRTPKGRRGRAIPIDATLLTVLEGQRQRQAAWGGGSDVNPGGYIFANLRTDDTGMTPRRPGWLSLAFKRLCARHKIDTHLHALRHWNATMLLDAGVPLTTVAERLGHAQVSTTSNIYTHHTKEGAALAVAALERALPVP